MAFPSACDTLFSWQTSHLTGNVKTSCGIRLLCGWWMVFLITFSVVDTYFSSFYLPCALDCAAAGVERWLRIWN